MCLFNHFKGYLVYITLLDSNKFMRASSIARSGIIKVEAILFFSKVHVVTIEMGVTCEPVEVVDGTRTKGKRLPFVAFTP